MATPVHLCEKRGSAIICPACGRIAPDFCPDDQPEGWGAPAGLLSTGSDLTSSIEEREGAKQAQQEALQEVAEAFKKITSTNGSLNGPKAVSEARKRNTEVAKCSD